MQHGIVIVVVTTLVFLLCTEAAEPNPPQWPASVHIFGPDSRNMNVTIQNLYEQQRTSLYGSGRFALLFKPGIYDVNVPVGYYTTVHGLGKHPENVSFVSEHGVHQAESGQNLVQFWRSAENLYNRPTSKKTVWSVSQASPLRRMIVDGDLILGTAADTLGSGGFISGVQIQGRLNYTRQQQWISRNCEISGGISYFDDPPRSVNFVFVGTNGSPKPSTKCTNSASNPVSPEPQKLVARTTPISVEKPYIRIDISGKYELVTPKPQYDTSGVQWAIDEYVDGFENVFVANNITTVSEINDKLAQGLHVILTPGIYSLDAPIKIGTNESTTHQVLLGLGLATLIPMHGGAAIEVANVPGIRIAGILLQAGPASSKGKTLISVGNSSVPNETFVAGSNEPISLLDVFGRVGGPDVDPSSGLGPPVSVSVMMEVNASDTVIDNVWLWRADVQNAKRMRDCNHSLIVNGHNVTVYGLAAEHVQSDNVVWNGENGKVYFYQAELDGLAHMPGDKTPDFGPNGVSGYRVNAKVHRATGVGVYCWFSSPGIIVESGVKVAHKETVNSITCPFQWVWENANTPPKGNSTIKHAILVANDIHN